jgi:hypothetical protein
MEHRPLVELQTVADLTVEPRSPMSRRERLARWAELLERDPKRRLSPLHEIEYKGPQARRAVRAENSPLTVAYEDPVLRAEGLGSDMLGDALDFFGLTEDQAHFAFCSCHMGSVFEARTAARRVRSFMPRDPQQRGRLWGAISALFGR